jgi:hypothetical protein
VTDDLEVVGWTVAVAELGASLARRLAAQADHRDLQGRPCWLRHRYEALAAELDHGNPG